MTLPLNHQTADILEEMKEQETRRYNLIVHNLAEPDTAITDKEDRIEKDIEKLQELLGQIEVQININETYRFAKRLGPRNDDGPRPLLIGFKERQSCDMVLKKSHELAEKDEPWSSINIIRDLTKSQRKEEKEMRGEVEKKNRQLAEDEKGNW